MSECSLSGRGQGHVSNIYIVDLENFARASRRYTGDIHDSTSSVCLCHLRQWEPTRSRHGWVHIVYLNLQLHTIDLVRTCRISSFCTVAWQLARFQLTRRIARPLGDSWASCPSPILSFIPVVKPSFYRNPFHCSIFFSFSRLTTWFPRLLLLLLSVSVFSFSVSHF